MTPDPRRDPLDNPQPADPVTGPRATGPFQTGRPVEQNWPMAARWFLLILLAIAVGMVLYWTLWT